MPLSGGDKLGHYEILRSRFGIVGWIAVAVLVVIASVAGWGWWHSSQPAEKPLVQKFKTPVS